MVEKDKIKEEFLSDSPKEIDKKEKELSAKGIKKATEKDNKSTLQLLSDKKYFNLLREKSIDYTKDKIAECVSSDNLIVQSINNIDELHKIINLLTRRLREWYGYYAPEVVHKTEDNELFVDLILNHETGFLKMLIDSESGANSHIRSPIKLSSLRCKTTTSSLSKLENIRDTGDCVFDTMRHIQELRRCRLAQVIDKLQDHLSIGMIQALAGFIQNQDCRMLHHRPGDQQQPLLSI